MTDAGETARVYYLSRLELYQREKPYALGANGPKLRGAPSNLDYTLHDVPARNIRGREGEYTLSSHGFQLCRWNTSLSLASNWRDAAVVEAYRREVEEHAHSLFPSASLVQAVMGRFHRVNDGDFPHLKTDGKVGVLHFAHKDESSTAGAQSVMAAQLQEQAELRGRPFEIYYTWRCLDEEPLNVKPLAFCDHTTVDPDRDLETCDVIYKDRIGEGMRSYYNPDHSWFYLGAQTKEEIWVFRSSSSSPEATAPCPLHAAIVLPPPEGAPSKRNVFGTQLRVFY